jgi:glycolate oxidase iron-sulfur subunit
MAVMTRQARPPFPSNDTAPAPLPLADATSGALLRGQLDNALACIRCGLCLSVCPTYQISFAEEEGPRGRIAMARAVAEGRVPLTEDISHHSQTCLLCDACTAICPAGVRMEPLGTMMREVMLRERPHGLRERLLRWLVFGKIFNSMTAFRAACRGGFLYQRSGLRWLVRRSGLLRLLGLKDAEQLLPAVPSRFLVARGQRWRPKLGTPRHKVALFAGCIMSTAFAETDRATARLLARAGGGSEVVAVAGQQCCGALHVHNGEAAGARDLARRNVRAFAAFPDAPIVVNAAGCGSTLKNYGHLLQDDPEYATQAQAFAARVRDLSEHLLSAGLPPAPACIERTVTLQEPCHLAHAQGIREAPRRLLRALPGVSLVEMEEPALCCGSAGVYNVVHPREGATLQARKVERIRASGAPLVVTANPGCQVQLAAGLARAGLPTQVCHIADLLDQAYGGASATDIEEVRP